MVPAAKPVAINERRESALPVDMEFSPRTRPGWGCDANEKASRAHSPKGQPGLLNSGRKA
jgi:hypothetical protein